MAERPTLHETLCYLGDVMRNEEEGTAMRVKVAELLTKLLPDTGTGERSPLPVVDDIPNSDGTPYTGPGSYAMREIWERGEER